MAFTYLPPAEAEATSASSYVYLYEEWFSTQLGALNWQTAASGAGAGETVSLTHVDATHPGVLDITTGTTATGRAGRHLGAVNGTFTNGFVVGGGVITQEWLVRIDNLSTAIEEYNLLVGNADGVVAITAGIYFWYRRSVEGVNWQAATRSLSTNTYADTGVAVVANQWIKLKIVVDATASKVDFYINDTYVATNTTNIPTVPIAQNIRITKTVGTTARLVHCDYFEHTQTITGGR